MGQFATELGGGLGGSLRAVRTEKDGATPAEMFTPIADVAKTISKGVDRSGLATRPIPYVDLQVWVRDGHPTSHRLHIRHIWS